MTFYAYTKKSMFSKRRFLCTDGMFHTKSEIKRLGLRQKAFTDRQLMAFAGQMIIGKIGIKKFVYFAHEEEKK